MDWRELGEFEDGDGSALSHDLIKRQLIVYSFSLLKVPSLLLSGFLFHSSSRITPPGGLHVHSAFRSRANLAPSSTKWLSERELHIAQGRLVKDVGLVDNPDEAERSGSGILHGLKLASTDIKVWTLA